MSPLSPLFKLSVLLILIIVVLIQLSGCRCNGGFRNMSDDWCEQHPAKSMSWDQENLKKADAGCPTSIFVPDGTTTQLCPP